MAWSLKVEIAFATDPMAAVPTWTDVTAYVLYRDGVQVSFGRPDEFSTVQPSTLAITLNNADGRFTPGNGSGAYSPNVKIGKRIRVTATRSAVNYVRFDGHVNNWDLSWPTARNAYAEVHLTATDRSQRLGETGELRSMLEEEVLQDDPGCYFPLGEPSEATTVSSIAVTPHGTGSVIQAGTGGTASLGGGTGPGFDSLTAAQFEYVDTTNGKYLQAQLAANVGTTSAVTLECWFNTDVLPTGNAAPLASLVTLGGGGAVNLYVGTTFGFFGMRYVTGNDLLLDLATSTAVNDGLTHHGAVTLSRSGTTVTVTIYLDGASSSTTFTAANLDTYGLVQMAGRDVNPSTAANRTVYSGTLSHVAAYSAALSSGRLGAHHDAGTTGLAGERSDQRLGRIADWIALPAADRNFDTGDSTVGAQATSGRQPIEAFEEVAVTEQGVIFFEQGDLTFHNRSRRFNTSPTITLSVSGRQVARDLEFPGDDTGLVNDITVTRAGAPPARAVNQTSIDTYGLRRESVSIAAATDNDCQALANWRVTNYSDPLPRLSNVAVDLSRLEVQASSQVALLLAATIGTRVQLSGLPSQAPASAVDVFIEGWTETFDQRTWRIVFNTSPADSIITDVWELGTAGSSELGTTTRLAY